MFAELRDSSDEQAEALSEPMVAVTILAGTAMFLSTATAGQLFDDPEFDTLLIAVEAFFAGVLVAAQNYWLGGAALLLGLRSLGSMARYRTARQIVGLSTTSRKNGPTRSSPPRTWNSSGESTLLNVWP